MSLTPREAEVLNIIVESYIENALPVGSRYVAKQSRLSLSPASMRNIMADLSDKGYLMQPHTSAGRIPTDKGFRYYVDTMVRPDLLPENLQQKIKEYLNQAGLEFSDILEHTSKLISSQSSLVGMAVAPQMHFVRWQQIDFVYIRSGVVMAILIFQGGIVQHKLLSVDEKVTADDLVKYRNYLNERFQGHTLYDVKQTVLREMQEAQNEFNQLYSKALSLARAACSDQEERQVYVDGTLNVWDQLDGKDLESMRELLEFLEQRSELFELLDKISQREGLTITFGKEVSGSKLGEWSIISSPYRVRGEPLGVIGTIGPIHMDYSRLVPMVDYIARMLSEILESRF